MKKALNLAAKGKGFVSPNPMVGAVLVKNGQIIAEGFHKKFGGPHAEIDCLKGLDESANGATLYVNLEPCSHYGKTPPCTEAILRAGLTKVVMAMEDPNPLVAGKGMKFLQENGINVISGILEKEARILNEVYIKNITTQKPFVAVKVASTLDGKIATKKGHSKWITGSISRDYVHSLRSYYDGILVGINTILTDNPSLNCRLEGKMKKDPVRIILDSGLRIPLEAKVIDSSKVAPLVVFTLSQDEVKINKLKAKGVQVVQQTRGHKISIDFVITKLTELNINSLLVEGGSEIIWSFFNEGYVDKYYLFIAPKIIGGGQAVPVISGEGVDTMDEAIIMKLDESRLLGDDILLTYYREL